MAVTLTVVAALWRRADLLVVAAPFIVVVVGSVLSRPGVSPHLETRLGRSAIGEGEATRWVATLDVGGDGHDGGHGDWAEVVSAEIGDDEWFQPRPAGGAVVATVRDGAASLELALRPLRWGRRDVPPALVVAASAWGSFAWFTVVPERVLVVLPAPGRFDSGASTRPRDGLVGVHGSSRVGSGAEFAAVRPFRVGDRMRRINWSRSSRSRELYVNDTWAERDLHVALLIDASEDVGPSGGVDGAASSLDVAVRAAGAVAGHHCGRGDRVSLRVFGTNAARSLPPATGGNHLARVLDTLSAIRSGSGGGPGLRSTGTRSILPAGEALTVLFSPLVTSEVLDAAVDLGRHGLPVVVVDTLPDHLVTDDDPYTALAWRIRLLERRRELRLVQDLGVPVVRWRGPGSLDQFLGDIARRVSAPRLRIR